MISFALPSTRVPDPDRASAADWAAFDAVFDPVESGSFPGTVAAVLAREDAHAHGVEPARSGADRCWQCNGDCCCPRPPVPGSVATWLADLAARPVDAGTRMAVAVLDPRQLTGTAVRDYLAVTDKVLAADTAVQHTAVLAVTDTVQAELVEHLAERAAAVAATRWERADGERMAREDVERTLRISAPDAAARIETATDLRDRLPATGALLAAGMVSARKAIQLSTLLAATDEVVAGRIDAELAPVIQALRPASLRRRVARRVAALDLHHTRDRERAVVAGRRVRRWTDADGAATLALTGPAEQVQRAWIAITGTALAQLRDCPEGCHRGCPHALTAAVIGDEEQLAAQHAARPTAGVRPGADNPTTGTTGSRPRPAVRPGADTVRELSARLGAAGDPVTERARGSLDRARFDATVDLLTAVFDAPWYATGPGRSRTLVQLVTTAATLTGLDEHCAELVGHGPVTAATARRIAGDADLYQDLLVHPRSGFLLDAGTIRHDPPQRLREFLLARRPTCSIPDCAQPATGADLDHGIEHHADGTGGPTAAWALGPLCRFHHRARTLHLWRASDFRLEGSLTWTDHTGRTWHQPAHDLRPDPGPETHDP